MKPIEQLIILANSKGLNLLLMYDETSFTFLGELVDNYGRLYRISEASNLGSVIQELKKTLD